MYARALWTILIGLIIPLIGLAFAQFGLASLLGDPSLALGVAELRPTAAEASAACAAASGSDPLCGQVFLLDLLRQASLWTAAVLIAIVVLFMLLALIAGSNRTLNAAIFPALVPFATLSIGALIFAHGAMITYCVYLAELWIVGETSYFIPGVAGLGALVGATEMLSALRSANTQHPQDVIARRMTRAAEPALWAYVDGVAEKLGARKPDHILVGFEPTFFATAAPTRVPECDEALEGETLYLSLPLMRLLTEGELRAVIAHELGHFRGRDTAFSLKFAPVFRRLIAAIIALEGEDGRADWITHAPGALVLRFMLEAFDRNRSRISREREFAADKAAMEVAEPRGAGLALAKAVVYGMLWQKTRADNLNRLREGKISPNLSKVFERSAIYDVSHQALGDILSQVLNYVAPHPTDTHPPMADRYAALGFDAQQELTVEALTHVGGSSAPLFKDLEARERELTVIEHKLVLDSGLAKLPQDRPAPDPILDAAYVLAVTMIFADERVERAEIGIAESIGARLFQNFDPVTFRELFDVRDQLPSFDSATAILDEVLVPANKKRVLAFLTEIAAADGDIHAEERALLNRAAARWGLRRTISLSLPGRAGGGGPKDEAPATG